ncbi:hypothetical protein O181_081134 [Austropuccinia psidii MF-1]|uniref:Uncharacterized protein n=1 Tax=Austropuccinia psidii MF-1 TaxID=1389203 RepID=A0A9Q3IJU5_9BASI|nr:hypothetical protein [Austropuccinia psidii MF-1]
MGFKPQSIEQNPPNPPDKTHLFHVFRTSKPHGNPLQAQVAPNEPSQHNEPPIPGPSTASEPPEDVPTYEPEPEVALTQSTEEPFACPTTPRSVIIIDNMPVGSPHSHNDARQEFTDLRPTLMIPQSIFHESINRILLEHCCLLHMIPSVDAPGIRGGTRQPPSPGTGGLSKEGHHRDSLQIS